MADKMKTLKVDVDGSLSVVECSMPEYNEYQALVKTLSCGVCNGTDGKLIHRTFKGFTEDMYPIMLGHEAIGEVIEVGSKVVSYKKGDHVLLPFAGPIDDLECGWGSYSEYGVVCDAQAFLNDGIDKKDVPECAFGQTVLDPAIDPVKGAMIITLREVLSSIKRFGVKADDSVVVFGCGPVGLTFIQFLSLIGVKNLIALDIIDEKLETAKERGAQYVFNSNEPDIEKKIRDIVPGGVDYVIDAVGVLQIINIAMKLIRDAGKICCYGISAKTNFDVDWSEAPYNWTLQFQQFPSKIEEGEAHEQVLAWMKEGKIDLDDYISDIVPFEDILSAFEKLERKEIAKKCIISYV